jgi:hypothetical protein
MSHPRFDRCPPDAASAPTTVASTDPRQAVEPAAQDDALVILSPAAVAALPALCAAVTRAGRRDLRVLLVPTRPGEACDPEAVMSLRIELARRGCAVPVTECPTGAQALAACLAALGVVRVISLPEVCAHPEEVPGRQRHGAVVPHPDRGDPLRAPLRGSPYAAPLMPA